MALFNFIETVFFISLGISFVLILLLVYHFKQRLTTLEQKGDTMFDIINNIVKEVTNIKNSIVGMQVPFHNTFIPNNNIKHIPVELRKQAIEELEKCDTENNSINDENDETDDDGDGEDDDGDDSSYGSEADSNEVVCENFEPNFEDVSELLSKDDSEKNVKVINIELNDSSDQPNTETQNEEVIIHKIVNNSESNDIDLNQEIKNAKMDDYRKMSLSALKAIVISKGLCSDSSKMKKNDLLKLLESEDDL